MVQPLFSAACAFVISLATLPAVITITRKKNILILPGGRRIHTRTTPTLGGIGIFLGFSLSVLFFTNADDGNLSLVTLAVATMPVIAGLCDDLLHLRPRYKLAGQIILALLAFFFLDVRVSSFYGLVDIPEFSIAVAALLTVFVTIFLTNSFNLIDGVDGLAGTVGLIALTFFGIWFYLNGESIYTILCFSLAGAIVAFLVLNWEPARIFMGETGSLLIGFVLTILTLKFMDLNHSLPAGSPAKFDSSVGTALCVLIVPITDTIRIIILRVSRGVSPFTADKRHIHHCLVRLGLTHRLTVAILGTAHMLFISVAVILKDYSDLFVLGFAISTAALLCVTLEMAIARHTYTKH